MKRIQTVDDDVKVDILICTFAEPLLFADNKVAPCAKCFRLIQFRPHAPEARRLCEDCGFREVATMDDPNLMVTKTTVAEVALYRSKGTKQ